MLTSESVTEGHPDKLCDQVSDAVLDAILAQDKMSRVACEAAVTTGVVFILGEITTNAHVDLQDIVRGVVRDIGYNHSSVGFDWETCGVISSIKAQSADIAQGIDLGGSFEARRASGEVEAYDLIGAGDQGMMIGFACTETEEYMPMTVVLAHRLVRQLAELRKNGQLPYLRPDGKSQVTIEYAYGVPKRIDAVVVSTQHNPEVSEETLHRDIEQLVIRAICPPELMQDTHIYVNPTGRFVQGGPASDAGLTGRKIIVDSYGGIGRHGGGAFSGKDPTKVDRSGAYAARHVAKNVVAAGLAERLEIQVSYAIGVAHPTSIGIETFGTAKIAEDEIERLIAKHFDLRPAAIIDKFDLRRPIYRQTASYGHFGRPDLDLPWERLDKVDDLRRDAGLA